MVFENSRHTMLFTALLSLGLLSPPLQAQVEQATEGAVVAVAPEAYEFTDVYRLDHTAVKSQDNTGTCWSFATASFMESELLRQGKGKHDLSEMFIVRNIYQDKARNYLLRQGKANFSQGALAHDYINAVKRQGLMPEEAYSGLVPGEKAHNHSEMEAVLMGVLEGLVKQRAPSQKWPKVIDRILDVYMGAAPENFSYQGKDYTPESFAAEIGFNAKDYLSLTSYSHHPFGESFVLEIPDNFSNGSFLNVPIDDLVTTIDRALAAGYTVAWDGDVSERGFLAQQGLAVLPAADNRNFQNAPGSEESVTQERRQQTFETLSTTDDHLMHLVGSAKDQLGNKYYIIKNSWGGTGKHDGFLYMS